MDHRVVPVARLADRRGSRERLGLRLAFGLVLLIVAAGAANLLVGFGGSTVHELIRTWGSMVVYVAAAAIVWLRVVRSPQRRRAWTLLAAGLALYSAGNIVRTI